MSDAETQEQPEQARQPEEPELQDGQRTGSPGAVTEEQVKLALRKVKDPELNLNVIDLGLVYGIDIEGSAVRVDMSLTSPACPAGTEILTRAEEVLRALPGVDDVSINLVWSPMWTPERIEPRVRAYLGF